MSDLSGTLVVSLEHAVAAPYASCKLADAGARVIKVERPEGDFARNYDDLVHGESAYFVWINRGKESICLDVKDPADHAFLCRMLGKADVFIQNMAPGVMDRMKLSSDDLRRLNPRLIICSISGYGTEGPARDQKAYDLLIQAETGLSAINGTEHGPARVGVSVCDIAAGMTAYQAILEALIARQRSGEGRLIEVSLFHAMADWMNVPYLQYRYGGKAPERLGLKHPTIAPYGAFTCADGKVLLIAIQNDREWTRFCTEVLQEPTLVSRPGWRSNPERVANRAEVDARVAAFLGEVSRDAAVAKLERAKIAFGRFSDLDDLVAHPQHRFISVTLNGVKVDLLAPGAIVAGRPQTGGAIPQRNAHAGPLRAEFAEDPAELAGERRN